MLGIRSDDSDLVITSLEYFTDQARIIGSDFPHRAGGNITHTISFIFVTEGVSGVSPGRVSSGIRNQECQTISIYMELFSVILCS